MQNRDFFHFFIIISNSKQPCCSFETAPTVAKLQVIQHCDSDRPGSRMNKARRGSDSYGS